MKYFQFLMFGSFVTFVLLFALTTPVFAEEDLKMSLEISDEIEAFNTTPGGGGTATWSHPTYFHSVKWITRNGVVSLSIEPRAYLYTAGSGNLAMTRANLAFTALKNKYQNNSLWKNTRSMEAQFHCHVLAAGSYKTPWNLEPHRTETNLTRTIAKACNP